MLHIKTKISPSKIEGLGLFANQEVKKGTVVWSFTKDFDLKFTKAQILKFPRDLKKHLKKYAWLSKKSGMYCYCSDEAKYFNHSSNPNCLSRYLDNEEEVITIALRNISKGEELTDNYNSFDQDFKPF